MFSSSSSFIHKRLEPKNQHKISCFFGEIFFSLSALACLFGCRTCSASNYFLFCVSYCYRILYYPLLTFYNPKVGVGVIDRTDSVGETVESTTTTAVEVGMLALVFASSSLVSPKVSLEDIIVSLVAVDTVHSIFVPVDLAIKADDDDEDNEVER